MAYPDKINALVDVTADQTLAAGGHAARHNDVNDALDELEAVFTAPAANELALRPDGTTEAVRIDSSGNVGIGTTSPGALLDVDGDAEVNGVTVGRGAGDVDNNTAVGRFALNSNTTGAANTAIGRDALRNNTIGINNTALGREALINNTEGGSNTATGINALHNNTTGDDNTVAGRDAMFSNTSGNGNTAIGRAALADNTTGNNNTAIGRLALSNNTTGVSNSAIGLSALVFSTTGDRNTATGQQALYNNTTGSDNTAIGWQALYNNTTGFDNTAIGRDAGDTNTSGHNNTFIGHDAVGASATANDTITLGDSAITTLRCQVTTITSLSDRRDKKNIQPIGAGLSFVEQLEPVAFDWNMRSGKKVDVPDMGFIAQDLLQVMEDTGVTVPNLVSQENPDALEAGYGALIPVLVQAVKELSAEVKALKEGK